MLNKNYVCALDIGSSKISACVAGIKGKHITSVVFDTALVKGMRKGAVVDSIDLVGCISGILKNLKVKSGINIKVIYTNISGPEIITKHSRAIIPLAERGNKVIMQSDIDKANDQARILGSSLDEEIIHQIPASYVIDSRSNILNPLGLYSHRLEADLLLISAKLSLVQSLTQAVNQSGFEIKGLFFSGVATSEIVFNQELKTGLSLLCDIGSDITELVLLDEGLVKSVKILSVGGDDLTSGLAEELKIPLELAEDLKRSHGILGDSSQIKEDKEILLKQNTSYKPIKQRLVSQVLTAKANALSLVIKKAVEEMSGKRDIGNFVVAGRAVLLDGFMEILENNLSLSAKMGRITHPDIAPLINREEALSGQKYITYLTCLGLICQALRKVKPQVLSDAPVPPNLVARIVNKAHEVYQEYF